MWVQNILKKYMWIKSRIIMILISQNITNYSFNIPENAVFRINLAWINHIDDLKKLLEKHSNQKIFLDLPINRIKPPNNKYSFEDLILILEEFNNIKYLAISNVSKPEDIKKYLELSPSNTTIVPKIESRLGIENIKAITCELREGEKIIMLDHDDLFFDLIKSGISSEEFSKYVNKLVDFCNENKIELLRTIGVIFADERKNVSNYVK